MTGPYRTPASVAAVAANADPTHRSHWKRLLCWIGFHEGPFTIGLHVIVCDACRRVVDD